MHPNSLEKKRALIIGMGGLGSPVSLILAQAGVGTLGLADEDRVDISNLHRQILYRNNDIGKEKTECAARKIYSIAGEKIQLELLSAIDPQKDIALLKNWDVIIDGTDSIETKFALSDAAVHLSIPLVHAGVIREQGLILSVLPNKGPCYRCLFESPPTENVPSCQEAGVFGAAAGFIGSLQAAEAIKILYQQGTPLCGRVLTIDLFSFRIREVSYSKNPRCRACAL